MARFLPDCWTFFNIRSTIV